MVPIRFDPIRELSSLQREMDDLFKRMFGSTRESGEVSMMTASPLVNSYIKDGMFHMEAELPGVESDKLDVRLDGRDLVISGERRDTKKTEEANYLLRESHLSSFERRMTLPAGADTDKAHATYTNGLLEVTMPVKTPELSGRKIPIEGRPAGKKSKEIH